MFNLESFWGSDIETDGLLDTVSQFHCGVMINAGTRETLKYGVIPMTGIVGGFKEYVEKLEAISASPDGMVVFHNGINYDIPAIKILKKKYFGKNLNFNKAKMVDTLVLSRLMFANLKDKDLGLIRSGKLAGKFWGRHSLEAWGYRLGEMKGEYKDDFKAMCKEKGWEYKAGDEWLTPSQEMLDYNVQDVVVTLKLFERFLTDKYYFPEDSTNFEALEAIKLEHDAQWVCSKMERNGFPTDVAALEKMYHDLQIERAEMLMTLRDTFESWYKPHGGKESFKHPRTGQPLGKYPRVITPKVGGMWLAPRNKAEREDQTKCRRDTRDTWAGCPYTPVQFVEFNPNSNDHLIKVLTDRGWEPTEFTDKGNPKCDDETLEYVKLKDPVAQHCLELVRKYLVIQKLIAQAAEGKQAWLKNVKSDGRIHGSINPCGAVTGRATHSSPNMAQVPANGKLHGETCRGAFGAHHNKKDGKPDPWIQVGVDASGLELRCLGHFAAPYDNGEYAENVLNGDIHWTNAINAGLAPNVPRDKKDHHHDACRDNAKTFIYAFLYGAGAAKIGSIVGGAAKEGKELTKKFMEGTPAIKSLREGIAAALVSSEKWVDGEMQVKWKRRWMRGLDGRKVHVRSPHSALNTLLQSAGALICKKWIVEVEKAMIAAGYKHGWDGDFAYMAWVHDELQIACRTQEIAEHCVQIAQDVMRAVGEHFKFRCQLDTEGKIGKSWKECH